MKIFYAYKCFNALWVIILVIQHLQMLLCFPLITSWVIVVAWERECFCIPWSDQFYVIFCIYPPETFYMHLYAVLANILSSLHTAFDNTITIQ